MNDDYYLDPRDVAWSPRGCCCSHRDRDIKRLARHLLALEYMIEHGHRPPATDDHPR